MAGFIHRLLETPGGTPAWRHGCGASRADRLIFVEGQHDLETPGGIRNPGRALLQADAAMAGVRRAVESVGGRFEDVVKLVVFHALASEEDEAELLRRLRARVAGEIPPVLSLVALPRLWHPDMSVLVKALAVDNADGAAPRRVGEPAGHWAWPAGARFSHGLRCGEFAFVSAQSAKDGSARVQHADDIVAQAKLTIANIARVLESMGCDLDDVVKLNTWYFGAGTDADWRRAAEVRSSAFRFPGPGATGVPVPRRYPDGAQIRQECWALRGTDGARLPRALSWPLGHWDWPIRVSFQQGIRVGRMIFLGGQYSMDERGLAVAPEDMAAQIDNTLEFIRRILVGFGAGLHDVMEVTAFYKHASAPEAPPLHGWRFGAQSVPLTQVPLGTMGLEGVTIEIEGYAVLPERAP